MRILQLLPTLSFGDAVSNDARAIERMIREDGMKSEIYAEHIDPRLPKGLAKPITRMPVPGDGDLLIYHLSTGSRLSYDLPKMRGRKMIVYHNCTPPEYLEGVNPAGVRLAREGYAGIRNLADKADYCVADSEYNKQDLRKMGYTCDIDVCPIVIPFSDYDQAPDPEIMQEYEGDGWVNWLFVGRVVPNKKQEDLLAAFAVYNRHYNPLSRLFIVGSDLGMEIYGRKLRRYAEHLGLGDRVVFTGHTSFPAILAYYRLASVFVCMSEHEGFCVPIVEAMYFDKPIAAYAAAAVPDTMGKAGLLLKEKDPAYVAAAVNRLVTDADLQAALAAERKEKLKEYSYDAVKARFGAYLKKALSTGGNA